MYVWNIPAVDAVLVFLDTMNCMSAKNHPLRIIQRLVLVCCEHMNRICILVEELAKIIEGV